MSLLYWQYNVARQDVAQRKEKAKKMEQGPLSSSHKRIELWVSPVDGSRVTDHVNTQEDVDNPRKMPCNEVLCGYILTIILTIILIMTW